MLKKIATTHKKDVENNIIYNIMMYFHKCGAYGRYNASDKYLFYFNVFSEVRHLGGCGTYFPKYGNHL